MSQEVNEFYCEICGTIIENPQDNCIPTEDQALIIQELRAAFGEEEFCAFCHPPLEFDLPGSREREEDLVNYLEALESTPPSPDSSFDIIESLLNSIEEINPAETTSSEELSSFEGPTSLEP